jgi:hypothetical protein
MRSFLHSVQRKLKDYHEGITSSDTLYHHHELQIYPDALFSTEYDLKQSTVTVRVNLLGAHVLCAWRYWRQWQIRTNKITASFSEITLLQRG